ncbi:MAG: three-Cys-motif partner protein TcmP [Bacteroidia bacterium]|jgi:three-Cys-motif partner protein|nr:three-Cys-motif partner protein TcmP [Bacteroidia bacterium]
MSNNSWGGQWTEIKLDAFIKYVRAYLTIMKKYPYWQTIYFDGFAGVGQRVRDRQGQQILDLWEGEIPEDIDVYKGASKRVLEEKDLSFDYYYFIDKDKENISSLEQIANNTNHISRNRIIIREDDCNAQLTKLASALSKKKLAALIFLDPFGMQIIWDSIQQLKKTRSDIWILIPSGVSINRLLPKNGKTKSKKVLEGFFGLSYDEIHNHFYAKREDLTLFGQITNEEKIENPIDKIISLYQIQLKKIWTYCSHEPLILYNSKKAPIFHLIFASNNEKALKIANQIISKRQRK